MRTFTAGKFTVEVGDPSPTWINLIVPDHGGDHRFEPQDLPDLRYVVERAITYLEKREPGETA